MKAELLRRDGVIDLPELLTWRLVHTDGSSADSFELCFPTDSALFSALRGTRELRCVENGEVRFRGVVDEVESLWENSFVTTLCGRGFAAKLMDNQVEGAEFYTLDLDTVLSRYVRPYGVSAISVQGGPWRTQLLSVGAGSTCQQVLHGFCLHAGAPQPRFLTDGTLCIAPGKGQHTIRATDLLSAARRLCRYGVISSQKVIDLSHIATRTAEAPALSSFDIASHRVATRSGPFTRITERSARQRLEASAKNLDTVEVVLPGYHPAQPCDRVILSLPDMATDGNFTVTEVCRHFDGKSETTKLCLRAKEV
ncbi:MAG: hypothetical protein E7464_03785 [Ruminococcaceae bacterium]|nr:hypothetical protein [Oscillospiraceae bacterium]